MCDRDVDDEVRVCGLEGYLSGGIVRGCVLREAFVEHHGSVLRCVTVVRGSLLSGDDKFDEPLRGQPVIDALPRCEGYECYGEEASGLRREASGGGCSKVHFGRGP